MKLTRENVGVLAEYLDVFDRPGYQFVVGHSPPGDFPCPFLSNEAMAFAAVVERHPGLEPDRFRIQTPQAYVDDPTLLNSADAETLMELLFLHVRADRFATGHLAEMLEAGHITAILRRLQQILDGPMGTTLA